MSKAITGHAEKIDLRHLGSPTHPITTAKEALTLARDALAGLGDGRRCILYEHSKEERIVGLSGDERDYKVFAPGEETITIRVLKPDECPGA